MTKETDSNHNTLNINELPPPIGGGNDSGYPEVPVNSYIIRLVSQLLDMADTDYTLLSPNDKAALHDLLRFGSLEKMAKLEHKTIPAIRKSVSQAICALKSQILAWQNPHQEILTLTQQVKELEDALQSQGEALSAQKAECEKLERENLALQERISLLEIILPATPPKQTSSLTKADEMTKRLLDKSLEEIYIPTTVTARLRANNIKRVYHLVRLNKHQLHNLKGVRHYDVIRICRCLDAVGLHLDTPVRWVEEVQEYYIKKSITKI